MGVTLKLERKGKVCFSLIDFTDEKQFNKEDGDSFTLISCFHVLFYNFEMGKEH